MIINISFGIMAELKYFVRTVTNENGIDKEIKSRSNSGNVSYPSVQSRTTCCFVLEKFVSHRVFEIRVLRRIFGPKREK
jgi:hypothetical protein